MYYEFGGHIKSKQASDYSTLTCGKVGTAWAKLGKTEANWRYMDKRGDNRAKLKKI